MANRPAPRAASNGGVPRVGPNPSTIQVAKPFVFEQRLQESLKATGVNETKEDTIRLQGVTWIDNVRKALQLPVRTFNTAVVYYHKFRLVHADTNYDYRDAAAAALLTACKIEDTLKKSRDVLCAAYNLKLPASEHVRSDNPIFDNSAKTVVGFERLMLQASAFDFRNRHPQKLLIKLLKSCDLDKATAGMTAYTICLDLYRTFAPLKQTSATMAMTCLELAVRICDVDLSSVTSEYGFDYERWATSRPEVMETLVDLLDLYTHHRTSTLLGPEYSLETFIQIRITLNQESTAQNYARFTEWHEASPREKDNVKRTPGNLSSANGTAVTSTTVSPQTPSSVASKIDKDGTLRFMLDPQRARDEKTVVDRFFKVEEEEVCNPVKRTLKREHAFADISPFGSPLSHLQQHDEDLRVGGGSRREIPRARDTWPKRPEPQRDVLRYDDDGPSGEYERDSPEALRSGTRAQRQQERRRDLHDVDPQHIRLIQTAILQSLAEDDGDDDAGFTTQRRVEDDDSPQHEPYQIEGRASALSEGHGNPACGRSQAHDQLDNHGPPLMQQHHHLADIVAGAGDENPEEAESGARGLTDSSSSKRRKRRTRPCRFHSRGGAGCRLGARCRFAHD